MVYQNFRDLRSGIASNYGTDVVNRKAISSDSRSAAMLNLCKYPFDGKLVRSSLLSKILRVKQMDSCVHFSFMFTMK